MLVPLSAQQTIDRARSLMQAGRGAALPELLRVIETLSANSCEVTVSDLSELIEQDAVVLAKILAVANTLAHNPGVSRLESLSQAIHLLGYNRIRTVALSLMLLDAAGGESSPPEQREAATRALCAGLFAQGAAEWLGTHDPEFAFACATLRNFGRIMFAAISPDHCRAAAHDAKTLGDDGAHRAFFGLTVLEFSRHLLASARVPGPVLDTLRDCEPESLHSVATTFDARFLGIVDYGSRVAQLALDSRIEAAEFTEQLATLARRFDRLVPQAAELARPALRSADDRLRKFAQGSGRRAAPGNALGRLGWRIAQLAPAAEAENGSPAAAPLGVDASAPAAPASASENSPGSTAPWNPDLGVSDAFEFQSQDLTPGDPLADALIGVRDGVGAEECWWFRRETAASVFTLTHGLGPAWGRLLPRMSARTDERSVFGIALTRAEVVLIHDTADATLRPYLPAWFRNAEGPPAAFALVPHRSEGKVSSLILVGWSQPRRIALTVDQIAFVHRQLDRLHPAGREISAA